MCRVNYIQRLIQVKLQVSRGRVWHSLELLCVACSLYGIYEERLGTG